MKLMIVEDETIIRNGILRHIPWERLGIDEVYTAANADEALALFDRQQPEIVLTDIQMPGINGVEMSRRLRERSEDVQIIFLTGFVEKEYLKGAINLQAVRYIEKPVVVAEVCDAISQAVENIGEKRIQKEAVLHRILMGREEAGKNVLGDFTYCQVVLIHTKKKGAGSFVKQIIEKNDISRWQDTSMRVVDLISSNTVVILLGKRTAQADRKEFYSLMDFLKPETEMTGGCFIAVGEVQKGRKGIPECYRTAGEVLQTLSWRGWDTCAFYPAESREYQKLESDTELLEQFGRSMSRRKFPEALEMMDGFWCRQIEDKVLLGHPLYYMANEFFRLILQRNYFIPGMRSQVERMDFSADEYETLEDIRYELEKCLKRRMASCESEKDEEQKASFIAQKVIRYMYENYQNPELSIKILADYVYLTPTYLSNLFKKQTNQTIGQYLTDIRMEEAKKRIRDPKFRLYEIADLVGYRDANYFAKMFKKKTGYTPKEYREGGL